MATGKSGIGAVYSFIKDKLDEAELREFCKKFDFDPDADLGEDEPPYRGRDVPLTGGTKAQDAALRKRVADAQLRNVQLADDHRASLGLSKIRNLGP